MPPTCSVVITNYNYGPYVLDCVASVVDQDVEGLEIVVVDDGSTDDSLEKLRTVADPRVRVIAKPNGGVIDATNRGFAESAGEAVVFLDADDRLLPGALRAHLDALADPAVVRSQGFMLVERDGQLTETRIPSRRPREGDLKDELLRRGPNSFISTPTSGNAWRRSFLAQVLPLPDTAPASDLNQDALLMDVAPLFGLVRTVRRDVAVYRLHTDSRSQRRWRLDDSTLVGIVRSHDVRAHRLREVARNQGLEVDEAAWMDGKWRLFLMRALLVRSGCLPREDGMVRRAARCGYGVSGRMPKKLAIAGGAAALAMLPQAVSRPILRRILRTTALSP